MGKLLLGLLPILLVAAACSGISRKERLEAELSRAETDVERGGIYYKNSCNRCHALYSPRSYDADEWKFYVRKYGRKARLSKDQRALVYAFLQEACAGDLARLRAGG